MDMVILQLSTTPNIINIYKFKSAMTSINISTLKNKKDQSPIDQTLSYSEFVTLLTTFQVDEKHRCPAFIGGHLSGKKRLTSNLHSKNLLILDLDSYKGTIKDLECDLKRNLGQYKVLCYSTSSHTPETPRIRIILFFEKEVSTSKYPHIVTNFLYQLSDNLRDGIDVSSSTTANKIFYLPIKPTDEYQEWTWENAGQLVVSEIYDYELPNVSGESDQLLITTKQEMVKDISIEEIKKYLESYPSDQTTHDEWFSVGLALHHRFEGKNSGLLIWDRWSEIDKRYPGFDHLKKRWETMGQQIANPITFASIIHRINNKKIIQIEKIREKISKKGKLDQPLHNAIWVDTKGKFNTPMFTETNFQILLKAYKIKVKFDVIKKEQVIFVNGKATSNINDALTKIKLLCSLNNLPYSLVNETVNKLANDHKFNSWKEWIENKKWDGNDRLAEFNETVQVSNENEPLKKIYLWKWLLQLIHATCINDQDVPKMSRMVLTFQGNSSIGKTTWVSALTPPPMNDYGATGVILDTNKDASKKACIEHVVVELGELASTYRKSDIDALKNFISATTDNIDIKYVARAAKFRRMTVFCATVNEMNFLQDQTGNTRFLCLPVIRCNGKHNIDMQQLYAQILEYALAHPEEDYNLTKEETKLQTHCNKRMESISPIEEIFIQKYDIFNPDFNKDPFNETPDFLKDPKVIKNILTATGVLEELGYNRQNINKGMANDIAKILDKYGFKRIDKSRLNLFGWYLPPKRIIDTEF